jgi:hypothetical protein
MHQAPKVGALLRSAIDRALEGLWELGLSSPARGGLNLAHAVPRTESWDGP